MVLEMACLHVDGIKGEYAVEARQLSQLVVETFNALVDLGCYPSGSFPNSRSYLR
jgi:hypothetical protein